LAKKEEPNSNQRRSRPGRPRDKGLPLRRRAQIITHAIEHFARLGYAGADLDAIAADVGCAKGTLYNYFTNKEKLFASSVDHVMRGLSAAVDACDSDHPLQQIEHLVRSFLKYFNSHPQYIELLMQERSDFRDRAGPSYVQFRKERRKLWTQRLRRLMNEGQFRPMPPERALDVLSNLLYGTIFTNYFQQRRSNLRQQTDDVLAVLFNGLLTPDEQSKRTLSHKSIANR
jgi:AcrR family transcriptional regulator